MKGEVLEKDRIIKEKYHKNDNNQDIQNKNGIKMKNGEIKNGNGSLLLNGKHNENILKRNGIHQTNGISQHKNGLYNQTNGSTNLNGSTIPNKNGYSKINSVEIERLKQKINERRTFNMNNNMHTSELSIQDSILNNKDMVNKMNITDVNNIILLDPNDSMLMQQSNQSMNISDMNLTKNNVNNKTTDKNITSVKNNTNNISSTQNVILNVNNNNNNISHVKNNNIQDNKNVPSSPLINRQKIENLREKINQRKNALEKQNISEKLDPLEINISKLFNTTDLNVSNVGNVSSNLNTSTNPIKKTITNTTIKNSNNIKNFNNTKNNMNNNNTITNTINTINTINNTVNNNIGSINNISNLSNISGLNVIDLNKSQYPIMMQTNNNEKFMEKLNINTDNLSTTDRTKLSISLRKMEERTSKMEKEKIELAKREKIQLEILDKLLKEKQSLCNQVEKFKNQVSDQQKENGVISLLNEQMKEKIKKQELQIMQIQERNLTFEKQILGEREKKKKDEERDNKEKILTEKIESLEEQLNEQLNEIEKLNNDISEQKEKNLQMDRDLQLKKSLMNSLYQEKDKLDEKVLKYKNLVHMKEEEMEKKKSEKGGVHKYKETISQLIKDKSKLQEENHMIQEAIKNLSSKIGFLMEEKDKSDEFYLQKIKFLEKSLSEKSLYLSSDGKIIDNQVLYEMKLSEVQETYNLIVQSKIEEIQTTQQQNQEANKIICQLRNQLSERDKKISQLEKSLNDNLSLLQSEQEISKNMQQSFNIQQMMEESFKKESEEISEIKKKFASVTPNPSEGSSSTLDEFQDLQERKIFELLEQVSVLKKYDEQRITSHQSVLQENLELKESLEKANKTITKMTEDNKALTTQRDDFEKKFLTTSDPNVLSNPHPSKNGFKKPVRTTNGAVSQSKNGSWLYYLPVINLFLQRNSTDKLINGSVRKNGKK